MSIFVGRNKRSALRRRMPIRRNAGSKHTVQYLINAYGAMPDQRIRRNAFQLLRPTAERARGAHLTALYLPRRRNSYIWYSIFVGRNKRSALRR